MKKPHLYAFLGAFLAATSSFAGTARVPANVIQNLLDRCTVYLSAGFAGKHSLLYGIPTPNVIWGPHSLQNVIGHRLGAFAGGGLLSGQTYLHHPYGSVTVEIGSEYLQIEVDHGAGDHLLSLPMLIQLKKLYPGMEIFSGNHPDSLQASDLETGQFSHWRIQVDARKFPDGNFREAAREIAYRVLGQKDFTVDRKTTRDLSVATNPDASSSERDGALARLMTLIEQGQSITKEQADSLAFQIALKGASSSGQNQALEWLRTNADSSTERTVLRLLRSEAPGLAPAHLYGLGLLQRHLVDYGFEHGFSSNVAEYLDSLRLAERINLVGQIYEQTRLDPDSAFAKLSDRSPRGQAALALELEDLHLLFTPSLLEGPGGLNRYLNDNLGLDGGLGYYDQGTMNSTKARERKDQTQYNDRFVQLLHRIGHHRIQNAILLKDTGRNYPVARLLYPSTDMAAVVLDFMASRGVSSEQANELFEWKNSLDPLTTQFIQGQIPELTPILNANRPQELAQHMRSGLIDWEARQFRFADLVTP